MQLLLVILSALSISLSGCSTQKSKDLANADKVAYEYVTASVEGNDQLFKKVVLKDDQGSLEDGYFAHPGLAKKMGNRYVIKRFTNHYDDNKLYYYVEFYHTLNERTYAYNLLMVKDKDGKWKSTSLTGISASEMKKAIEGDKGTLVHSYKEGESVVAQD